MIDNMVVNGIKPSEADLIIKLMKKSMKQTTRSSLINKNRKCKNLPAQHKYSTMKIAPIKCAYLAHNQKR
jgi:hypothetical protein